MAVEKGSTIYVYDDKGQTLCIKNVPSGGGLAGYTGSTFTVRGNGTITTYDERGNTKFIKNI